MNWYDKIIVNMGSNVKFVLQQKTLSYTCVCVDNVKSIAMYKSLHLYN